MGEADSINFFADALTTMTVKNTIGSPRSSGAHGHGIRSDASSNSQKTGTSGSVAEKATRLTSDHSIGTMAAQSALLELCRQINSQADWMAVHSAAQAKDCLTSIIPTLKDSPHCLLLLDPSKLSEPELQAWSEFCESLSPGPEQHDFVQKLADFAVKQINCAMDKCCTSSANKRTAEDLLKGWARIASKGSYLSALIKDAESFLESLPPPVTTPEAQINDALNACCDPSATPETFQEAMDQLTALESLAANDPKLRALIVDGKAYLESELKIILPSLATQSSVQLQVPSAAPFKTAEAQINAALAKCYTHKDGEDPLPSAFATLVENEPLATRNRHLKAVIEDAQTFLRERLKDDIEACATEHGSNPLRLWPAINLQVVRIDKIGKIDSLCGVTAEAYAALGQLCAKLPVDETTAVFVRRLEPKVVEQIERSIASNDIAGLVQLVDAWRPVAHVHGCTSLKDAIYSKALRHPLRPSGTCLYQKFTDQPQVPNLTPKIIDLTPDLWPMVFKQLTPSKASFVWHPVNKEVPRYLLTTQSMSQLNRWFHQELGALMPEVALNVLKDGRWWFSDPNMSKTGRWTKLPHATFLKWTQNVKMSSEERLSTLLGGMLDIKESAPQTIAAFKDAWATYFTADGPLKADYGKLPLIMAQALMRHSDARSDSTKLTQRSLIFEWLEEKLNSLTLAESAPAWVELGIGARKNTIVFNHIHRPTYEFADSGSAAIIKQRAKAKLAPWPAAAQGIAGIAAILLNNDERKKFPRVSDQQLTDALAFGCEFSKQYPLQGSLKTAIDILQNPDFGIILNSAQSELLKQCLDNDAGHRAPKTLAIV